MSVDWVTFEIFLNSLFEKMSFKISNSPSTSTNRLFLCGYLCGYLCGFFLMNFVLCPTFSIFGEVV